MFKYTTNKSTLRTIRQEDTRWMLRDHLTLAPRAGFEIDEKCPREYRTIIGQCIERGWLKPIANVKDQELFWEELQR